jgi:hypothetical protein
LEVVAVIDFNGIDIVIQHDLGDEVVRRALAETFLVPEGRISLINDIGDYPRSEDFDVVCVSSQVEGEFARLLSIQSNHVALPYETRAQLTQALCEHLGIQYITPDDDDTDPYFMWLISPGGAPSRVGLDPVAFDEDRYVIARRV